MKNLDNAQINLYLLNDGKVLHARRAEVTDLDLELVWIKLFL